MIKTIVILSGLVGYEMAVKVYTLIKMAQIDTSSFKKKDFEELLNDPKYRKYMR